MDRRVKKQVLKAKSKMPRSIKEKMSINECNKGNNDRGNFGLNIPNNYREAILLDKKNGKALWSDAIAK